jgi:hypothetical protein
MSLRYNGFITPAKVEFYLHWLALERERLQPVLSWLRTGAQKAADNLTNGAHCEVKHDTNGKGDKRPRPVALLH